MILRGNIHLARAQVLDRLIAAPMAELELEGLSTHGETEHLMSEADPKDRGLSDELADILVDVSERCWIAGTVRQENTIGLQREHILGAGISWNDPDLESLLSQPAQDVPFHPEVVRHDGVPNRRELLEDFVLVADLNVAAIALNDRPFR